MHCSSPAVTLGRKLCPLWPHLAVPCTWKVSFISGHHSADGTKIWQHFTFSLSLWLKCFGIFPVWQDQNVTNIVNHILSLLIDDNTFCTLSSVWLWDGHPECSAEATLALNMESYSETCVLTIVYFPKATLNTLKVSIAYFSSSKQILI
jgi:hypothetical protein